MSGEALYGLDRPDELKDLDLKDASQEEIIEAAYKAWLDITEETRIALGIPECGKPVYQQARRILRPFKEKFDGSLYTKDFYSSDFRNQKISGYYLTALLNETNLKRLVINKLPPKEPDDVFNKVWGFGYRLQPGKMLELLTRLDVVIGYQAEGGYVINHGEVHAMGVKTSGGIFLNYGEVGNTGLKASGGLFVNLGMDRGVLMPKEATGGTFVSRIPLKLCYFTGTKDQHAVDSSELEEDDKLSELLEQIERAGVELDFQGLDELGRKIDEHVRKKYPRKVA